MEEVEHPSATVKLNEPPKKKMPLITTYKSDEEDDDIEDFEDNTPLIRASIAPFPACDVDVLDLSGDPTPPPSDSSDVDEADRVRKEEEEAKIASLVGKSGRTILFKWLNSSAFQQLRQSHSSFTFSEKERVPRSFVIFFHETVNSMNSNPSEAAVEGRSFGEIVKDAMSQWKRLSPEERHAYRKRAFHSKLSYTQHLLEHRAKLRSVPFQDIPRCTNAICQQPVVFDPRWNLDYCSTACLVANCKTSFQTWLRPRPLADAPPILPPSPVPAPMVTADIEIDSNGLTTVRGTSSGSREATGGSADPVLSEIIMKTGGDDQERFGANIFERVRGRAPAVSGLSVMNALQRKDFSEI